MNQTIRNRIAKLREAMERAGVDYYMVPTADFHNSEYVDVYFKVREYLSGFTGSNGTLVVSRDEAGLWTDVILSRRKMNWRERESLFSGCWMKGFPPLRNI